MSATGQYINSKGHKTRKGIVKRNYPNRFQARKALLRRIALDWLEMGTYPCNSGNELHYHFGHSTPRQRWESHLQLQRWRYGRFVKRPYYEGRQRLKYLFTGKLHQGAHIGPSQSARRRAREAAKPAPPIRPEPLRYTHCHEHGTQRALNVPGMTGGEWICIECI